MKRFLRVLVNAFAVVMLCLASVGMAGCGEDIKKAEVKIQVYNYTEHEFYDVSEVTMTIDLYRHLAPKTVDAIASYVNAGYYNDAIFYQISGYDQIMFGDLYVEGDRVEISDDGATVNIKQYAKGIKPTVPGEYPAGGTVGSDLKNVKGAVGLWRNWYEAGTDYMTSGASNTGRATCYMPTKTINQYDGYFCIFGQIDFENTNNSTAFKGLTKVFDSTVNFTKFVVYYTEKDGGYDATKDDYNLEFHCVTKDYFDGLTQDEKDQLNMFEAEGNQMENFNQYVINVPNNSDNTTGKIGAKIISAKIVD